MPIANISLAVKDILAGDPDPLMTVVAWLVTAGAAGALAMASTRLLSKESLITSVQSEPSGALGGLEPFRRDVLRWTAAAWALILVGRLCSWAPARTSSSVSSRSTWDDGAAHHLS